MNEDLLKKFSETGSFKALCDTLGFIIDRLPDINPDGLADFGEFRKKWKRYSKKLEEGDTTPSGRDETMKIVSELLQKVFAGATRFYVPFASLFDIKDYSLQIPDLSYSVPRFCAGCSSEIAEKTKKFSYFREIAGMQQRITLEFPFCKRCARSPELFIDTRNYLAFSNPSYGYTFAVMNDVNDYKMSFQENDQFRKVEKKLVKLGRPQYCRGIPWDMVADLPEFR